ncbi:MAG: MFS transporter [Chloroflexi bacterium]|nr:MFS transporter [Chloroflexota bacterium]
MADGQTIGATSPGAASTPLLASAQAATAGAGPAESIGTFHALGLRDYRLLWISNLFASAGMWIQMATLGWVVYDLTGSGTLLGAMNGTRAIPFLLLAPLAGVAADRMNRRAIMLGTQVVTVLIALGLAIGLALDRVIIWHLFAFSFISAAVQVFYMPVQQTVVFDLVPRRVVPNAVALGSAAFNITRVLGPSIAGFLIAGLGPEGNFFVQSAAYMGVVISIAMITFPVRLAPPGGPSVARNIAEGFRYVVKDRTTRVLLMLAIIPPLLIIPSMMALMPVFAKDIFHSGPTGLGLLLSASGLGGLLGALFTASLGRFERRGLMQLGVLLLASSALFAFGFTRSMGAALPLLVVAGFGEMIYMTTNQTMLQLSVPDHMRGRVTSLFMLTMALMPAGAMLFGGAADLVGAPAVVKGASAAALGLGLLLLVFAPRVRNLRLSQVGSAAASAHPPAGSGA